MFLSIFKHFIKKSLSLVISFLLILTLSNCMKPKDEELKTESPKKEKKRRVANIDEKTKEAAGEGFILGAPRKTIYEFNSANPIWRASLDVLEDIPILNANYAGGVIATDWYSVAGSNESIKIQIVFSSNEVQASSFKVKGFKKSCVTINNCKISKTNNKFNETIKKNILEKTREISLKEEQSKKK